MTAVQMTVKRVDSSDENVSKYVFDFASGATPSLHTPRVIPITTQGV
jgi:hypothetical protein